MTNRLYTLIIFCFIVKVIYVSAIQICPKHTSEIHLTCAVHCCESLEGTNQVNLNLKLEYIF